MEIIKNIYKKNTDLNIKDRIRYYKKKYTNIKLVLSENPVEQFQEKKEWDKIILIFESNNIEISNDIVAFVNKYNKDNYSNQFNYYYLYIMVSTKLLIHTQNINIQDVDITFRRLSLYQILEIFGDNRFIWHDYYNNKNYGWTEKNEISFVESIIIGFPIENIYVKESVNGDFFIIDGVCRLLAIKKFILDKTLILKNIGLDFMQSLNNQKFDTMDRTIQRKILAQTIGLHIIPFHASVEFMNLFIKKINTSPKKRNIVDILSRLSIKNI